MSSHLYAYSNGQDRIYPCQVPGCPRGRNNSVEKKNVRWFDSKNSMVKHLNRKHNICIKSGEKRLHNIGMSQGSIQPIRSAFGSQETLRRFPCLIEGCDRARNESKEKVDFKWFTSKLEMTRHLNKEHGAGICTKLHFNSEKCFIKTVDKTNIKDTKLMHKVLNRKERNSRISSNHEISSFNLPTISPKCEPHPTTFIEFSNDSLDKATREEKGSPYLPPLSPNGPSSKIAFDHKMLDYRPSRMLAHLKGSRASTDSSKTLLLKTFLEAKNNTIGKNHSASIENNVSVKGNKCDAFFPGQIDQGNKEIEFAYICAFCNWKTSEIGSLNYHIWDFHFQWVNGHKMINCLHCPYRSEKLWELAWHTRNWHLLLDRDYLEKGYLIYCLKCNEQFLDFKIFEYHKESGACNLHSHCKLKDPVTENGETYYKQIHTSRNASSSMQHEPSDKCMDKFFATYTKTNSSKNKGVRFFHKKDCSSSHESVAKKRNTEILKATRQKPFWEKYC